MTDKTVKVGDVVAWDEVPAMALVKPTAPDFAAHQHFFRYGKQGWFVGSSHSMYDRVPPLGNCWPKWDAWTGFPKARIVALNLTGNETADELRALAEAFEREHPAT